VGAGTLLVDIEAPFRRLKGAGPCEGGLSFAGAIPTRSDSTLAAVVRGLSPGLRGESGIGGEWFLEAGPRRSPQKVLRLSQTKERRLNEGRDMSEGVIRKRGATSGCYSYLLDNTTKLPYIPSL
jgi:hypothetical protein